MKRNMKNNRNPDLLPECGGPVISTSFQPSVSSALPWNIHCILLAKLFKIFCTTFRQEEKQSLFSQLILQNLKWQMKSKVAPFEACRHIVGRGRAPIIRNFCIKHWWLVSIELRPKKSFRYPLDRERGGPHSRFGCLGDETKIFSVPWIELIEYVLKYKYNIYILYLIFMFQYIKIFVFINNETARGSTVMHQLY